MFVKSKDAITVHVCVPVLLAHTHIKEMAQNLAEYIPMILSLQISLPISGIAPFSLLKGLAPRSIVHVAPLQSVLHDQDTGVPPLVENVTVSTPAYMHAGLIA